MELLKLVCWRALHGLKTVILATAKRFGGALCELPLFAQNDKPAFDTVLNVVKSFGLTLAMRDADSSQAAH